MAISKTPRLSALVVARNEAARLGACLDRLGFADEILVVLDRSTDDSVGIARAKGAVVLEGAWELEGPRRNAGISACTGDWILEVDADELVSPALAAEIRVAIASVRDGYFMIAMANYIGAHRVRYGWGAYNGPAGKAALFRKGDKVWGAGRVHPAIKLTGPRRELAEPLDHHIDRDIGDMFARLNRYTDLAARDAADKGQQPNLRSAMRRMFSRGWKSYVARRGYREGNYGVALALFSALYPLLIELKLSTLKDGLR